jgi:cytochrome bd-type quinol oxidase subunit 2
MIHPLLRLAATEPHLLGDHIEAYAALVGEEVSKVSTSLITRIALFVGALCMVAVGLVLVGVALLFCAAIPSSDYPAPWAMFVVPLAPFVIAAACVFFARSKPTDKPFDTIKKQLNADMAMLREVSAS